MPSWFVPPDGMVLVKRVIATGGQSVKGTANGDVFVKDSGPGAQWRKLELLVTTARRIWE